MTVPLRSPEAGQRIPWELATPLHELRAELYQAEILPEWYELIRAEGLDLKMIEAHAGMLVVCRVQNLPNRTFGLAQDGTLAAVIEVFGEDAATVIDLVAWPLDHPEQFATAFGHAGGLGLTRVRNPATYFQGWPLRVYRTPLAWLKAGCDGAVVLREESAFLWLAGARGTIAAEDLDHARWLARLLHPFFDPAWILVPSSKAA